MFNKDNYDGMYIIDKNNNILYAYNKINGLLIDKTIIPNEQQIKELELQDRINTYQTVRQMYYASFHDKPFPKIKPTNLKSIDEIKNYKIYGGLLYSFYSHILLTTKNGKFNLQWFRIELVEKDKFKLTTTNIPINDFTVDTVLNYYKQELVDDKKKDTPLEHKGKNKSKTKRKWFKNI